MDRLARHQDPDMRIAATNGYMELAPALGLPALLALKKDLDVAVRQAVQEAHDKLKLVAAGKQAAHFGDNHGECAGVCGE